MASKSSFSGNDWAGKSVIFRLVSAISRNESGILRNGNKQGPGNYFEARVLSLSFGLTVRENQDGEGPE